MPYPLPLTRTEAYLAYKAGVIQQSDLKPSLAVPRNGIDAWLAYWTVLTRIFPVKGLGKNLADPEPGAESKGVYVTYDSETGEITAHGTATSTWSNAFGHQFHLDAGKYTMTQFGSLSHGRISCQFSGQGHPVGVNTNKITFTVPEGGVNAYIWIAGLGAGNAMSGTIKVQIEKGESSTSFEKYTGEPLCLTQEEAYVAYLSGVLKEYPENALHRVGAYLRYLISARWGRPDHPLNREELYLSLIKTQYIPSGEPSSDIVIDGTAKAPFVDVKMYGDTYQQTYTGKNCIGFQDQEERTVNGLTYSVKDGIVTVNGTATSTTFTDSSTLFNFKEAGDITLSIEILGGTQSSSVIGFSNRNSQDVQLRWQQVGPSTGLKNTKAIDAQTISDTTDIRLYMNLGSVFNNFKFRLMAEYGSDATDYEPYVGGVPSPNPEYPQQIQTVTGEQTVEIVGKNLFDKDALTDDYYLDSSGAMVTGPAWAVSDYMPVKAGQKYTISGTGLAGTAPKSCFYDSRKTFVSSFANGNQTITIPSGVSFMRASVFTGNSKGTPSDLPTYMLELGESATTYAPYHATSYPINLGKNLFDKDTAVILTGELNSDKTYSTSSGKTIYIKCNPNTTYSVQKAEIGHRARLGTSTGYLPNGGTATNYAAMGTVASGKRYGRITTGQNDRYLWFTFASSDDSEEIITRVINSIQIEAGAQYSSYAPYKTPIELCKLGDYQDYIWKDGEEWKVHKATGKAVFNGSENWLRSGSSTEAYLYSALNISNLGITFVDKDISLSDRFTQHATTSGDRGSGRFNLYNGTTVAQFLTLSMSTAVVADVNAFKTWLASNNTTLAYPLYTATDTTITDQTLIAQLEALLAGGAENGTTYIKVSAADPNLPGLLVVEAPKYE